MEEINLLEVVKSPLEDKFFSLISNSKKKIILCSPFIKQEIAEKIIAHKNTKTILITHFNIGNFVMGLIDIPAIELLMNNNVKVFSYKKLNAKMYNFDDEKFIIGSFNLTNGGMKNNFEYGIYFDRLENIYSVVKDDFKNILNSENIKKITKAEINNLKKLHKGIKTTSKVINYDEDYIVEVHELSIISNQLTGWKKIVLEKISCVNSQIFSLKDIISFKNEFAKHYPKNNNIEAKIRQTLQYLAALGLIRFVNNNGIYKKLFIIK